MASMVSKEFRIVVSLVLPMAFFLSGCGDATGPAGPGENRGDPFETSGGAGQGSGIGPGGFGNQPVIVVLGEGEDPSAVARGHGLQPEFIFTRVMKGFAGSISEAARAGLLKDGRVRRIEADQEFTASRETTEAASWGLDRVDQRGEDLDGVYSFQATGAGVTAYIVDTGIRFSHDDFGGRAVPGYDSFGLDGSDCNGHGTHVAGTLGGQVYGVAKGVSLVSVRVLNCSGVGTSGAVLAGLDWIMANSVRPAVVNMSLEGSANELVDSAVRRLVEAGIAVAVAAGNQGADACGYSPARAPEAMTTAATTQGDGRVSWSNWGPCVDWFAPGYQIVSDGHSDDSAVATMSGTSMASPHTAGAAALYLEAHPDASPFAVTAALAERTTKGVVGSALSPANDLLYTLSDEVGGGWAPLAGFTFDCAGLTCEFTDQSWDADNDIVGWAWEFGDRATSDLQSPSHTYEGAGTYLVTLTATDARGATGSMTQQVTVDEVENQPPVAGFSVSCTGLSCEFLNESNDPDGTIVVWDWEFGDLASSDLENPVHSYSAAGVYSVTLTVRDNENAESSKTLEVGVGEVENQPPVAGFSVSCTGLSCEFLNESNDPDGTIVAWEWEFGDLASSKLENPVHSYSAAGVYSATLTVRDDENAESSKTLEVMVEAPLENAPPTAAFRADCFGLSCEFQDESSDSDGTLVSWEWDFGDGTSSVANSAAAVGHEFPGPGSFRVTLTVVDDLGAAGVAFQDFVFSVLGLEVTGRKEKGRHILDLVWQGATSLEVDIIVTGLPVVTTENTGRYRYETGQNGKGLYFVRVCEPGTDLCSAEVRVDI